MNLEVLGTENSHLGEGPLYHEGNLYWVDILGKKVNLLNAAGKQECLYSGNKYATSVVMAKDGRLLITLEDGFYQLKNNSLTLLGNYRETSTRKRFNDGKCDPLGRYWAGTMDRQEEEYIGSLYVFDGSVVTEILSGVCVSNGLCWSKDMSTFYYVDSPTKEVVAYDLDSERLRLTNKRTVFRITETNVYPDGMCIDDRGNLWLALWNGYRVICINPTSGTEIERISVPCRKVTSCCFGGVNFDELYITTASHEMSDKDWYEYPDSGRIFKIKPGVSGPPSTLFA